MIPGTEWWMWVPLAVTLSLNGPRSARIIRVITRVVTNVTTKARKHRNSGSLPASTRSPPTHAAIGPIVGPGAGGRPPAPSSGRGADRLRRVETEAIGEPCAGEDPLGGLERPHRRQPGRRRQQRLPREVTGDRRQHGVD